MEERLSQSDVSGHTWPCLNYKHSTCQSGRAQNQDDHAHQGHVVSISS